MEFQHGNNTVSDLRIQPANTKERDDLSSPSKNFSFVSSSSSKSDSSEDHSEPDADKTSTTDITGTHKLDKDTGLASEHDERDVPNTSNMRQEQSNHMLSGSTSLPPVSSNSPELSLDNGSTTQSPPVQTMEQTDSYRIPSSAFARNKSTTPMEWSVASNESLFSIHGNMSFTRDQSFLLGRSGELGIPEEPTMTGLSFRYSNGQIPAVDEKSAKLEEGSGVTEAAAGTKKEVLKENAEDNSKEKLSLPDGPLNDSRLSHQSDESRSSVQSFAFPILTSEGGRSGSLKVSVAEEQTQQQQQPQSQLQPQTSAATPEVAQTSWFSCFSCCSSKS